MELCGARNVHIIEDYVPPPLRRQDLNHLRPTRVHRAYSDVETLGPSLTNSNIILDDDENRIPTPESVSDEPQITRSILDLLDENFFAAKVDESTTPLDPNSTSTLSLELVPLLPGETLSWRLESVIFVRNGFSFSRRLLITNYQMLLIARPQNREPIGTALNWRSIAFNSIPVAVIKKVSDPKDIVDRRGKVLSCVIVSCKDSSSFSIVARTESDLQKLVLVLESVAFVDLEETFAFAHRRALDRAPGAPRSSRSPRLAQIQNCVTRRMSMDQITSLPSQQQLHQSNSSSSSTTASSSVITDRSREPSGSDPCMVRSSQRPSSQSGPIPELASLAYGWEIYDPMKEFARQQMDFESPNSPLRLTKLNQAYALCNSYPSLLVVPRSITDAELQSIASFRVENRIPVVSWFHRTTGACLVRCGQPLEGLLSVRRCKEDEKLLEELARNSRTPHQQTLVIDARPFVNAIANKMTGAGFENAQVYQNITVEFMGIGNIHTQRENLKKLVQTCKISAKDAEIDCGDWLQSISVILSGAVRISNALVGGIPVVVHCSDGWDRTPQLVSLAQLILDPHYRTLRGFQVLIEKEWNSFGHRFADRIGHAQSGGGVRSREISPIFTQFVDCVFQLLHQFPESFEFNELFLATILRHLYSCRFGTFMSNSEKTKKDRRLEERTVSLWYLINSDANQWQYRTETMRSQLPLQPKTSKADLRFWRSYYFHQYEWMEAIDVVKVS